MASLLMPRLSPSLPPVLGESPVLLEGRGGCKLPQQHHKQLSGSSRPPALSLPLPHVKRDAAGS